MNALKKIARSIAARIYRRQVGYEFPRAMLENSPPGSRLVPDGYEIRQPPSADDTETIANLLNQEPGFGTWDAARVRTDLLDRLAHPRAATLVLYDGEAVALGFATDASTRRKRIAHGMYLYVVPAHRRRSHLGAFVVYNTLGHCLDAGYDHVVAFTDEDRLSALLLYLSEGATPMHDCLSSYWKWRRIRRRLAPALQRMERQKNLRAKALSTGSIAAP